MIESLFIVTIFGVFIIYNLIEKAYKCSECGFRSDYDHIVEVTGENPYCPHCGTHTDYIGRRYNLWAKKLGVKGDSE